MVSASTQKILVFLAFTFTLSSVFYYLIISSGFTQGYSWGLMWCPGVAALITQLIFRHDIRGLGWSIKPTRYWLLGYGLPVAYGLVVYGLVWLTGIGPIAPQALANQVGAQIHLEIHSPLAFLALYVLISATAGVAISCGTALGEEIGWRGLLVPELAKQYSFTTTAVVSGVIWALWHYPAILFADYNNSGGSTGFGLVCFTVLAIGIGFACAWLRLKSDSLWPAVLLHASFNVYIQSLFNPLTRPTSLTPFVIGEFGLGLALVALVGAYQFWLRRGELPVRGQ